MLDKNFINGEWVSAEGGAADTILDPSTGEAIGEVASSSAEDVDVAVRAASDAFESWSGKTPRERSEILHRVADAVCPPTSKSYRASSAATWASPFRSSTSRWTSRSTTGVSSPRRGAFSKARPRAST